MATEQRTNLDLLQYCDKRGINWTVEVRCLAKLDEESTVHMFVASVVHGVDIQLPIYILSPEQSNRVASDPEIQDEVNEIFAEELHTLMQRFHQKKIK